MIRKIIIMCAVLAFLGAICMAEQIYVHSVTGEAMRQTRGIIQGIREKRFEETMELARTFDLSWDKQAKKLEVLVDHSSTDEVRYALSRLLAALEEEDSATAMVYACELEGSVEHVYERQELTLENIL